jgi:hypothetical protein
LPLATATRALALGLLALGVLSGSAGAAGDDGLIDDESYESPNFGYEIEWGRPWDVDTEGTFSEQGFDVLTLCNDNGCLAVMGLEEDVTPEESVEGYIEHNEATFLDDIEISEQDAADDFAYATFSGEAESGNILTIHIEVRELEEATRNDPAVHLIALLISPEDEYDVHIASAADDIEIDGDPAFLATDAAADEDEDDDRGSRDRDEDDDERSDDEDEDDDRSDDEDDDDRDENEDDEDDEDEA